MTVTIETISVLSVSSAAVNGKHLVAMPFTKHAPVTNQELNCSIGLWNRSHAAAAQTLLRAGNTELLHLGLERGALHP